MVKKNLNLQKKKHHLQPLATINNKFIKCIFPLKILLLEITL